MSAGGLGNCGRSSLRFRPGIGKAILLAALVTAHPVAASEPGTVPEVANRFLAGIQSRDPEGYMNSFEGGVEVQTSRYDASTADAFLSYLRGCAVRNVRSIQNLYFPDRYQVMVMWRCPSTDDRYTEIDTEGDRICGVQFGLPVAIVPVDSNGTLLSGRTKQ